MAKNRNQNWYRLDNAATIVPSSARGYDTRVFRMVCELKDEVDPEALQEAMNETAEEFPHFNVYLRKGFFWYYLDGTDERVKVEEEHEPALKAIYLPGRRNLLYRAGYFGRRINLEMFHVLTDGTGGFAFFKRLLLNYFRLVKGVKLEDAALGDSSVAESANDAFDRFYSSQKKRSQLDEWTKIRAYQIKSPKNPNFRSHLAEGVVSASSFLELAHRMNTTAGVLITALYIKAVMNTMSLQDRHRPIVIGVPVNLRQYFPSATTRNFFGSIAVGFLPERYDGNFDALLSEVKKSFAAQLTKESIQDTMNSYSELTHMAFIKLLPLFLKDMGIQYFSAKTRRGMTSTVSNVGRITMPPEITPYIDHFSAFMSTFNLQLCVLTFEDRLSIGSVSVYEDPSVMMEFFRSLTAYGLQVELGTNDCDRI